jgi:hypothetical protein
LANAKGECMAKEPDKPEVCGGLPGTRIRLSRRPEELAGALHGYQDRSYGCRQVLANSRPPKSSTPAGQHGPSFASQPSGRIYTSAFRFLRQWRRGDRRSTHYHSTDSSRNRSTCILRTHSLHATEQDTPYAGPHLKHSILPHLRS